MEENIELKSIYKSETLVKKVKRWANQISLKRKTFQSQDSSNFKRTLKLFTESLKKEIESGKVENFEFNKISIVKILEEHLKLVIPDRFY